MRDRRAFFGLMIAALLLQSSGRGQDSVDVTFRYVSTQSGVAVTGEFAGWVPGALPMTNIGSSTWVRTVRLRVGGNPSPVVPGAWQFKFWYNGVSTWPNDPLDHHVNPSDNDNSYIITKDPAIYQFQPNQRSPVVTLKQPTITAYIFPKVGTTLDTSSIALVIDGVSYTGIGSDYSTTARQLVFVPPAPLPNGSHTAIIRASSIAGGMNSDTVTFTTLGGYVLIATQSGYQTLDSLRRINGIVQNPSVATVKIVRNGSDTLTVPVSSGAFTTTVHLLVGVNTFIAVADSGTSVQQSDPATFTRFVNHAPNAQISFNDAGGPTLQLLATTSTDPDSGQAATLTFQWSEDPSNPAVIGGINGSTQSVITINRPTAQGEYAFGLIATDVDGHSDTTRSFFDLGSGPTVTGSTLASVPAWVRQGRVYEMFFKSHTPAGTINAAYPDLDRIAAMGYNIIWVMPIMKNRNPMDNSSGTGYDIVDFYNVAPEYGTNQDFKNFTDRAHVLGMKVILDVTPNHTSAGHPFVLDARSFGQDSRYWTYYQHQIILYTGPGLGELSQSVTSDGFVYYGGYSEELLNYNWADVDARAYMIGVYKWWIQNEGVDGYRLDSYWGPHTRANSPSGGEGEMGQPMRSILKHARPDIYLLGEAQGVGTGTEVLYSDDGGGVESAYDWSLKDWLHDGTFWTQPTSSTINTLDQHLRNGSGNAAMGFLPGPDAYFFRFLENHDEDRISYLFGIGADSITAYMRTMPVATSVNLAVGMPLVYAGQEVGRGYGISDFDQRRRGVITWNTYDAQFLMPHYQKLAQIRGQFPCFTTQQMVRASSSVGGVYAYTRPAADMNGVVVANFDPIPHTVSVQLYSNGSVPSVYNVADGRQYVATDLYNSDATQTITFTAGLGTLTTNVPAYGSAVLVIDSVAHALVLPPLTGITNTQEAALPRSYSLEQNFPNPFNPATTIRYQLPAAGHVSLKVYDLLGREVTSLVDGAAPAGTHAVVWDGRNAGGQPVGSGVYFYRLIASGAGTVLVRKMLLLR